MNIYFIPGLGADKKVFRNIRVPDGYKAYYLDWIPHGKHEKLENYSYRLAEHIDTSQPFVVVGLSFGGMLAAEIVNKYSSGKMILISSVPAPKYLPFYFRFAGKIGLDRLLPISLLKWAALMKRLFTAETPEQKAYLKKMIREVDASFIKWGLHAIVNWKGGINGQQYIHIHGSGDELLPARFCKPTHIIKGGGHLMVLTRSEEINRILKESLEDPIGPLRT